MFNKCIIKILHENAARNVKTFDHHPFIHPFYNRTSTLKSGSALGLEDTKVRQTLTYLYVLII